jgi:hypothetical protein
MPRALTRRMPRETRPAHRPTRVARLVNAGCFDCSGSDMKWNGPQAQGTAALHHDQTGHETWADVTMLVRYGHKR